MRQPLKSILHPREAAWFIPFACIALVCATLSRPLPRYPLPAHSRTVIEDDGKPVQVPVPLRSIALAPVSFLNMYLENTHAPELLVYAGDSPVGFSKNFVSLAFPNLLQRPELWNPHLFHNSSSPYVELETLLTFNPDVYLHFGASTALMRRIGITTFSDLGIRHSKEMFFAQKARLDAALIGHPELASQRIASYNRTVSDLEQELHPESLKAKSRVLILAQSSHSPIVATVGGEYDQNYFPETGVVNDCERFKRFEAEIVLACDPDYIFLISNEGVAAFSGDPRWQGLKAVRDKHVYEEPSRNDWTPDGMTFRPVETRWIAEIAHPDLLQPKTRQLLWQRMYEEFGYRLNDDQIDRLLKVPDNRGQANAERFTREYETGQAKERAR